MLFDEPTVTKHIVVLLGYCFHTVWRLASRERRGLYGSAFISDLSQDVIMKKHAMTVVLVSLYLLLSPLGLYYPLGLRAEDELFFKGKTVRIIVYTCRGGLYDAWARLLGQYLGRYIPGEPTFVVQNMPGGGGKIAMNFLYKVAKPDGLTIGLVPRDGYTLQLIGESGVEYDWTKFTWIGSAEQDNDLLFIRADTPYRDIFEFIKAKEAPRCGATGVGTTGWIAPKVLEQLLGANIRIVTGYPGAAEIDLAITRGEVVCRATGAIAHFSREPALTWHKVGFDRHLVLFSKERNARTPDTPTFHEVAEKLGVPKIRLTVMDIIGLANYASRPVI